MQLSRGKGQGLPGLCPPLHQDALQGLHEAVGSREEWKAVNWTGETGTGEGKAETHIPSQTARQT